MPSSELGARDTVITERHDFCLPEVHSLMGKMGN